MNKMYNDILKKDPKYKISENDFNDKFGSFEKVYFGSIINRQGIKCNVPAWRAFELVTCYGASTKEGASTIKKETFKNGIGKSKRIFKRARKADNTGDTERSSHDDESGQGVRPDMAWRPQIDGKD